MGAEMHQLDHLMLGRKASKSTVTARRGVREDRAKSVCESADKGRAHHAEDVGVEKEDDF